MKTRKYIEMFIMRREEVCYEKLDYGPKLLQIKTPTLP